MENQLEANSYLPISKRESFFWYILGISFLIFVPYITILGIGVRILDIISFILPVLAYYRLSSIENVKLNINKPSFLVMTTLALSQLWPLFGMITLINYGYSLAIVNILAPIRRFVIISSISLIYMSYTALSWRTVEHYLLKGIFHSAIVSGVWIILQQGMFLSVRVSVNKLLFREYMGLQPGHTFVNILRLGGGELLRATAFSWSPGLVGPPLLLIGLFYFFSPSETISRNKYISAFLLISPLLTFSRTVIFGSVIALTISVIVGSATKFASSKSDVSSYDDPLISRSNAILGFTGLILVSVFFAYTGVHSYLINTFRDPSPGTIRHVGYIIYLPNILADSIYASLFGYGIHTTGAGIEVAAETLPGIDRIAELYNGQWRIESQIISILVGGGLPGTLFFMTSYGNILTNSFRKIFGKESSQSERKAANGVLIVLISAFILGLGYGVGGTFFFVLILLCNGLIWRERTI